MVIRIELVQEQAGVAAVVANNPSLRAFGATQEEAIDQVLRNVAAHYHARVGSLQVFLEPATALTNEQLRELAKKHQPPASWYDEEPQVL